MSFNPGDLVRLKSGGPLMTVERVGKDSTGEEAVWCTWSDKVGNKHVPQREVFAPIVLEKGAKLTGFIPVIRS